jgi:Na+/melibiose symporter-like transporter
VRHAPGSGGAQTAAGEEPAPSGPRLIAYALTAAPLAVMLLPLNAFLPYFYNDVIGLGAATVGLVLLAARLADVVVDPLCGLLSDRTRSRLGRRRSWMIAGTPIFVLGIYFLFIPPAEPTGWYLLGTAFAVYLGWTMIQLPYLAWGGEAVTDYQGRARLTGFREAATIVGVVIAALVPALTARFGHRIDRFTMELLGWCLIVGTPVAVGITLFSLRDPPLDRASASAIPRFNLREMLTFGRPFNMILLAFIFIGLGKGIGNALTVYFATYVLEQPEVAGFVLFSAYSGLLVGTPFWVWATRKLPKHRAVALSLAGTITILLGCAAFLGPGDGWLFVGLEFMVGLAGAGYIVLPAAVIADAIDHDTLRRGRERFGVHFAAWSMAQKLVNALAVGIALPMLSMVGFDPHEPVTAAARDFIRFFYLILPAPLFIAGAVLFWRFPIDRRRHAVIRRGLERNRMILGRVAA